MAGAPKATLDRAPPPPGDAPRAKPEASVPSDDPACETQARSHPSAYRLEMWPRVDGLRAFSLGDPGPMREDLTARAIAGTKIATAGLLREDYEDEAEALEAVGERQVLLGPDDDPAALVEITRVEVHRLPDVPWEFARDEGEDFASIEHWRDGHRSYYARIGIDIDADTQFVCVWFRVVDT
jgi:uncharacterized protein YhfF